MANKKYIDANFDIKNLYKAGFLKSKTDYDYIEKRICWFFGFKNIFEWEKRINNERTKKVKADINTFSEN